MSNQNLSGDVYEISKSHVKDKEINIAESFASHLLEYHQISYADISKHSDKNVRIMNGKQKINVVPLKSLRWQNGSKRALNENSSDEDNDGDDEGDQAPQTSASERVKFILGCSDKEDGKPPHENPQLFTELEELFVYVDGNEEWKETARWFKYEEDVEESGDRWSKPRVAAISLYSLLELRSSLMAGTVILDMDASTLPDITSNLLSNLVANNKLDECVKDKVQETLLRKHHHHKGSSFRRNLSNIISRRSSRPIHSNISLSSKLNLYANLPSAQLKMQHFDSHSDVSSVQIKTCHDNDTCKEFSLTETQFHKKSYPSLTHTTTESSFISVCNQRVSIQGHLVYPSPGNDSDADANEKPSRLKNLLSPNAEASSILVGEVDYLLQPITAFIRLHNSTLIRDLTEVSIPTRFLFIMLGPRLSYGNYHEIGRAISTLMSNDIFHDVAYKAKSKEDLITGIDAFLEQVTVIPPGNWDISVRIEPQLNNQHKESKRLLSESNKAEISIDQLGSVGSTSLASDLATEENSSSNTGKHSVIGKQCSGLVSDLCARKKRTNDIKDGLNIKCIAASINIYLLLLAFIATVGDHEKRTTNNFIGVREHLLSFGINGLLFALFGGQPMLVMCYTLPIMVFDKLLFLVSQDLDFEFLSLRLWVGIWTAIFLIGCVILNVSTCIQYLTQFTLDIFAVVQPLVLLGYAAYYISIMVIDISNSPGMFVNQSCFCLHNFSDSNVINLFINKTEIMDNIHFRDCVGNGMKLIGNACNHGVSSLTLLVLVVSIFLVLILASFQHFSCFPKLIHRFLHDFSSLITVFVASMFVNQFSVNILYMQVPKHFHPEGARTSWVVPFFGSNQIWSICVAIIPAVFFTILIFGEHQLASYYVQKQFMLKKRCGYHLDLVVVVFGVLLSSILGLPFTVTSVILSVNKIRSLIVIKPSIDHYGGCKEIREQRVTAVLVCCLLLLTPIMQPLIKFIPLSVLYSIFIVAMCKVFINNIFVKRFKFLFVSNHHDEEVYLRQVPLISTNILTLVQALCVAVLCAVRASIAAFSFPFAIVFVMVVRFVLEFILPEQDLQLLDGPRLRFSCFQRKSDSYSHLILDSEQGIGLDVQDAGLLSHPSKMIIDIGDELAKTAAWKQLTGHTKNSLDSKNFPNTGSGESGSRRRRRRSRGSLNKNISLTKNKDGKECVALNTNNRASRKDSKNLKCDYLNEQSSQSDISNDKRTRKKSKNMKDQLPPWEQPIGSPPRKDLGLLEIFEDSLSIDPACTRTDSPIPACPVIKLENQKDQITNSLTPETFTLK
ncbi:sodium bicarbonate cotransporter 3 isoform X3 [Hydra vulgaris]|uniref:Sodium bicarbonate cotransporter 3 isoform X3 n=1 Tax=Hydra vulgaris TaxID=6087 RepID=A0ABM4BCL6_HYDVU